MPELPEVETVRRTLAPALSKTIRKAFIARQSLRGEPLPGAKLRRLMVGSRIERVRRWGKYLLFDLTDRDEVVVTHLGMTGRWRVHHVREPRVAHTHIVFELAGGSELRFSDPRRFGHVSITDRAGERSHPPLAALGVDAMSNAIDGMFIHEHARKTRRPLKSFLLDQGVIAGLGNIYVSEALWTAGIRPTLPGIELSRPRATKLAGAVHTVLERALERGGTSLRDFVAADGAFGENAHYLRVYDRDGQPCARRGCGGVIRRTVIQGRSTFHCPTCQRR